MFWFSKNAIFDAYVAKTSLEKQFGLGNLLFFK